MGLENRPLSFPPVEHVCLIKPRKASPRGVVISDVVRAGKDFQGVMGLRPPYHHKYKLSLSFSPGISST
jgi:hypothetical protein